MKKMSTPQIKTLRAIHENPGRPRIHTQTSASLARMGLLDGDGNITARGTRWIEDYIEQTGDGPEDLKAMFRV